MTVVDKPYSAIILAAGSGTRMAADRNKIFLKLANQAIFTYSLNLFLSDSDCKSVILVGKAEEKQYFSNHQLRISRLVVLHFPSKYRYGGNLYESIL